MPMSLFKYIISVLVLGRNNIKFPKIPLRVLEISTGLELRASQVLGKCPTKLQPLSDGLLMEVTGV